MTAPCPHCACTSATGAQVHALLALLIVDDLDAALGFGLLEARACDACSAACNAYLASARDARLGALAARERHRARAQRLARRQAARDGARVPPATTATTASRQPALPAAAADALARALAKAGGRKPP